MPLAAIPIAASLAIAGGASAAGSVASSLIADHAANNAAQTQMTAAQKAALNMQQAVGQTLPMQQSIWNQTQANYNPYVQLGQGATGMMANLMGIQAPQSTMNLAPQAPAGANAGSVPVPQGMNLNDGAVVRDPSGSGIFQVKNGWLMHLSPEQYAATGKQAAALNPTQISQLQSASQSYSQAQQTQQNAPTLQSLQAQAGGTPSGTSQLMRPTAIGANDSSTAPMSSSLQPTSLMQGFTDKFQAPTAAEAAATPGYQFSLQQGLNAMQNSAAAGGNLLSTGTMKSLNNYAQGVASTNYQQTYNNAMQQYLNNANLYYTNQNNMYNRLTGTAQMGAQMTGNLAQLGQNAGSQMGNTIMGGAAAVNQQNNNAAQAQGWGQAQQGAIYGNMANQLGQIPGQMLNMSHLMNAPTATMPNPGAAPSIPIGPVASGDIASIPMPDNPYPTYQGTPQYPQVPYNTSGMSGMIPQTPMPNNPYPNWAG